MPMPPAFVRALGLIKWAAADANKSLRLLPAPIVKAIQQAALEIASGEHLDQFPIDVFQTGSGTSSNMNANEVIAKLASKSLGLPVHANDHVNMSQSSNDVIPSAIHVSAALGVVNGLLPALEHLHKTIEKKAKSVAGIVKTGRTHLMDAMPVRLDQELGGWAAQILSNIFRLKGALPRLTGLAQGGTAVGTGINAHPKFAEKFTAALAKRTKVGFHSLDNFFEAMSSQDTAVEVSGILKTIAVSLLKIANDLRWMNSGPLAGLGEISLPALQPGSSIMPGKVNPVIPEAVAMVAAQVIGNDAAITIAGQSGNFQLNVMLPVVALNLIQSIELLASASRVLADSAIAGFKVNQSRLDEALERNPILVTALNPVIGYEKGAAIAKQAYKEGKAIREVAERETSLSAAKLKELLDPLALTQGGIKGDGAGGGG
jgi:fumarate hydratase class II